MQHSTCPYMRQNGTTADAPRSLEELMKRCTLLKPKLDPLYFRELGENSFHKLFRDTSQDIILTEYAHQSDSPASLYRPPPSAETGFSQMFLQEDTQDTVEWDGAVPGTQNGNPIIPLVPPFQDTTGVEELQSPRNNRDIFLLTSSDREVSDGDSEADLSLSERERLSSSPGIQECEDGMRESLTQAFSHNESVYNIDKPPALVIRKDGENLVTDQIPENPQTQDSDSFFASLDTILFQYTEQMQAQSQTKSSQILIQDETPLVPMGPSNSPQSSVLIDSPIQVNTDGYSSEYVYSSSESDIDTSIASATDTESQTIDTIGISPQYSTHSNLITGENATELYSENKVINIGNQTSPNFLSKRVKLIESPQEITLVLSQEKATQTQTQTQKQKQQQLQLQQNTWKLTTEVFKKPKPIHNLPWTTQEEKLLVIGVSKFGKSWKKIHTSLNFSPSRSFPALAAKYRILERNGDDLKYSREFRKNAGHKSPEQTDSNEADSDKI